MKKVLSIFILCLMVGSLVCVGVSGANDTENSIENNVEYYANLDIDKSTSETEREKILEARKQIIYSTNWVADGLTGYVYDVNTREIISEVPSFSEVFPEWDLPVDEEAVIIIPESRDSFTGYFGNTPLSSSSDWIVIGGADVYLNQPSDDVDTLPYAGFYLDPYNMGTVVGTYATYLTSSETYNLGYTDLETGRSLGYMTDLSLYQGFAIAGVGDYYIGIRASTYSLPGWSYLQTEASGRLVSLK